MTPQEKEQIRLQLEGEVLGTVAEWLPRMIVEVEGHSLEGVELRIEWQVPTDGAMIASLSESRYGDPIARYGIQVNIETLPDLPPIGPESDPAMIEESRPFDPDYPGCAPEMCGGSRLDPCSAILRSRGEYHDDAASWVPATFLFCLAGDRIRIGGQETDVLRSSSGVWHANNADAWHPTPWVHTELRMDLAANRGFQEYPPATACEILMTPERKAVHLLMQTFPGTQKVEQ